MIEELKRFLLVAQDGNLTRTAEKIFITQSALTQSIHRLEKNLNTKLFIQKGKQLQLTEDGKSIIIIGEKILQLWANIHDKELRKIQKPTYTLGMFDNIALRLGKFFQNNIQKGLYKLELTIDSSGKIMRQLQFGTLDAALCILNKNTKLQNNIILHQIYSEELIPVTSKIFNYPISHIPFILYNRGSNTRLQIDESFMKYGIQPLVYAESTSVTFMRELALLGCGVALLPENLVKNDLEQGILKRQNMKIQWSRNYGLFVQKYLNANNFILDLHATLGSINTN